MRNYDDFKARWPLWFAECSMEAPTGWYGLVWDLCEKIESYDPGSGFMILQIKEKFGGLRFYISSLEEGKYEHVYKLIQDAEHLAEETCITCSKPGKTREHNRWYHPLCDSCNDIREAL
jgi:hypothetical protein